MVNWNSYVRKSVHEIYLALVEVLVKNIPVNLTEMTKEKKKSYNAKKSDSVDNINHWNLGRRMFPRIQG